ncbi:MAG: DUF1622 domain-containing protein [Planctomycetes bacterium]|nr:DUF1622 domain-containing protein [Planctomycetota bacterium]
MQLNAYVFNICQLLAIIVISIGIFKAVLIFFKDALFGDSSAKAIQESRMELGHSFSLGLGFLIGSSILKTTITPSWDDIGQLAAIIAIRTLLNYFLLRDIRQENKHIQLSTSVDNEPGTDKED